MPPITLKLHKYTQLLQTLSSSLLWILLASIEKTLFAKHPYQSKLKGYLKSLLKVLRKCVCVCVFSHIMSSTNVSFLLDGSPVSSIRKQNCEYETKLKMPIFF